MDCLKKENFCETATTPLFPHRATKKSQLELEPCIATSLLVAGSGLVTKAEPGKETRRGKGREGDKPIFESLRDCDYFGISDPAEAWLNLTAPQRAVTEHDRLREYKHTHARPHPRLLMNTCATAANRDRIWGLAPELTPFLNCYILKRHRVVINCWKPPHSNLPRGLKVFVCSSFRKRNYLTFKNSDPEVLGAGILSLWRLSSTSAVQEISWASANTWHTEQMHSLHYLRKHKRILWKVWMEKSVFSISAPVTIGSNWQL